MNIYRESDLTGMKILIGSFSSLLLLPCFYIGVFVEGSFEVFLIIFPIALLVIRLMFATANITITSQKISIYSRFFITKRKEYDVCDLGAIKCVNGGGFQGVGSTTIDKFELVFERRGVDKYNLGDISLAWFFVWNVNDLPSSKIKQYACEAKSAMDEISKITGLPVVLDEQSKSWIV